MVLREENLAGGTSMEGGEGGLRKSLHGVNWKMEESESILKLLVVRLLQLGGRITTF